MVLNKPGEFVKLFIFRVYNFLNLNTDTDTDTDTGTRIVMKTTVQY